MKSYKYFYLLQITKTKYKVLNPEKEYVIPNYKYKFGVSNNYKKRFKYISQMHEINPIQVWSVEGNKALDIEDAVKEWVLPKHDKSEYRENLNIDSVFRIVESDNWKVKNLLKSLRSK